MIPPVIKNFFSNIYGVGVNLLNQILLVPFFIVYWGKDLYSDWLVITAVSLFFTVSDVGINSVTSNHFSIQYTQRKFRNCRCLFVNNFVLITLIALISLGGIGLFCYYFDLVDILGLHKMSVQTANFIFIVLTGHVFLTMYCIMMNTIYRARSLASRGTFWDNTARIFEVVILITGAVSGLPLTWIVSLYLIPRCILMIYKLIDCKHYFAYSFHLKYFDKKLLLEILIPSLGFLAFPLGNAIILQGFSLLINKKFGADAVVLYNTTRTLCNFIKTLMGTIAVAVWPEFSIAYGNRNFSLMRSIHRLALLSSTAIAIGMSLFLLLFGGWIFRIWTCGAVEFNFWLMFAFLFVLVVNNLWYTSSVTLMATNKHIRLGVYYVISSVIALFAADWAVRFHSLTLIVLCMLIIDSVLSIYVFRQALLITEDSTRKILHAAYEFRLSNLFKYFRAKRLL